MTGRAESADADTEPKRVLHLTKGLGLGGAERLIVETVRHLDASRYQAEVAFVLPWKDAFVDELLALGVRVHCLGADGHRVGWLLRLRKLLQAGNYDLVHTHMPVPAVAARLLGSRAPIVHTEHNLWDRYRVPTRIANALTYHRNRLVVAVSEGVAASIRAPVPRRAWPAVRVLLHGVDSGRFGGGPDQRRRARSALGLPECSTVVGTVGNFTAKKNQAMLLDAFSEVEQCVPDAHLVLIGSGPLEEPLRRKVAEIGLERSVHFAGMCRDVSAALPAFDVFALSSDYEGLPIALLEAMAAGVPPVVTAVGGIPEVVQDGANGRVVSPGRAAELAGALIELATDATTRHRIGSAARTTAAEHDIAVATGTLMELYDEVTG